MSIFEYLYNIFSILCIVDLIICTYKLYKNFLLVAMQGLSDITKIKLCIDKIVAVLYVAYIIYKLVNHFIIL